MQMPVIGYSTLEHSESPRTQVDIFLEAIDAGYRFFDVASKDRVLPALRKAITKSGLPREDFFVLVKLPMTRFGTNVCGDVNDILEDFGGPVDCVCASWPYTLCADIVWSGNKDLPKEANGYKTALQDLEADKTGTVGVANFDVKHLESLKAYKHFQFLPLVDENQMHPLYTCKDLRKYCHDNGIVFIKGFEVDQTVQTKKPHYEMDVWVNGDLFEVSEREVKANLQCLDMHRNGMYKTLTQTYPDIAREFKETSLREVSDFDPYDHDANPRGETDFYRHSAPLAEIGAKYGKTNRQVIDRWALQHGAVVLVKGIFREEMEAGKDIFDFELTEEEMDRIDSFNMDKRFGYHPDYIDFEM